MVKKSELYIPLAELTKVAFACDNCRALIVVDLSNDEQRKTIEDQEKYCPVCKHRFHRDLFVGFSSLLQWFQKAKDSGHEVYFIVNGEAATSSPNES